MLLLMMMTMSIAINRSSWLSRIGRQKLILDVAHCYYAIFLCSLDVDI